jgi:hypothetical protein
MTKSKKTKQTKQKKQKNQKKNKSLKSKNKKKNDISNCTSKIDLISHTKLDRRFKIVKFQPNPNIDLFNCYKKVELEKYIIFEFNKGTPISDIKDITTRKQFGVNFIYNNFPNLCKDRILYTIDTYITNIRHYNSSIIRNNLEEILYQYKSLLIIMNDRDYKSIWVDIKYQLKEKFKNNYDDGTSDKVLSSEIIIENIKQKFDFYRNDAQYDDDIMIIEE